MTSTTEQRLSLIHIYLPHKAEYVFDAIYNPPITATMRLANPKKARVRDGLFMLVMQAAYAQTVWSGVRFEPQACETILRRTYGKMAVKRLHEKHGKRNIVLCGFCLLYSSRCV